MSAYGKPTSRTEGFGNDAGQWHDATLHAPILDAEGEQDARLTEIVAGIAGGLSDDDLRSMLQATDDEIAAARREIAETAAVNDRRRRAGGAGHDNKQRGRVTSINALKARASSRGYGAGKVAAAG